MEDIHKINKELQLKLHVFGRYGITMFALSGIDIASPSDNTEIFLYISETNVFKFVFILLLWF